MQNKDAWLAVAGGSGVDLEVNEDRAEVEFYRRK